MTTPDLRTELLSLIEATEADDGSMSSIAEHAGDQAWAERLRALVERCPRSAVAADLRQRLAAIGCEVCCENNRCCVGGPAAGMPQLPDLIFTAIAEAGYRLSPAPPLRQTPPPTTPGWYYARDAGDTDAPEPHYLAAPNMVWTAGREEDEPPANFEWFGPAPMPEVAP